MARIHTTGCGGRRDTGHARFAGLIAGLVMVLGSMVSAPGAVVFLNLFNSEPLLDEVGVPLLGNSISGDLVELYTLGGDGMIDGHDPATGLPNNDDVLFGTTFNPTHVGAGTFGGGADSGILLQSNIEFDDSEVGTLVYARFWNVPVIDDPFLNPAKYGRSGILTIPGVVLGESNLDFAPNAMANHITNIDFRVVLPEPSVAVLLLAAGLVFDTRRRFVQWAVRPEHKTDEQG